MPRYMNALTVLGTGTMLAYLISVPPSSYLQVLGACLLAVACACSLYLLIRG